MNGKRILISVGCSIWALASANCGDKPRGSTPPLASPRQSHSFSGKVTETMDAGDYTYVRVDTGKEKLWAAVPKTIVKVGDVVTVADGMPMVNHHSKTLNRDFDVVYFAGSLQGGSPQATAGQAEVRLPAGHPPLAGETAGPKINPSGIVKAKGGKTIQEIYAGRDQLQAKTTTVRGKVVKFNAMIMGKNWLHIRDGSGGEGSNDLTVTTASEVKVGDTVLVSGVVSADKDFGAG